MAILLKTVSVRVSFIQIMQVRVQNKGKRVWKSRYDGDVSPSYDNLHVLGCLCYPSIASTTPHKLGPRPVACIFLEYPPNTKC